MVVTSVVGAVFSDSGFREDLFLELLEELADDLFFQGLTCQDCSAHDCFLGWLLQGVLEDEPFQFLSARLSQSLFGRLIVGPDGQDRFAAGGGGGMLLTMSEHAVAGTNLMC